MEKVKPPAVKTLCARGNGLCVVLPKDVITRLALNKGDAISVEVIDKHIVLTRVQLPKIADLRKELSEQGEQKQTA